MGILPDPEEAAKLAEIQKVMSAPIRLNAAAQKAVDSAHHPAQVDVNPMLSISGGDFSAYHATWDKHFKDTMKLDDDDDDDDDEEEEEEEEQEEEE